MLNVAKTMSGTVPMIQHQALRCHFLNALTFIVIFSVCHQFVEHST